MGDVSVLGTFGDVGDVGDIGVLDGVGVHGALDDIDAYMVIMCTAIFSGWQMPPRAHSVKPSVIGTSVAKMKPKIEVSGAPSCPKKIQPCTMYTSMLLKAPRTPMTLKAP